MATDARERLRAALAEWDAYRGEPKDTFTPRDLYLHNVVAAARALLAEPPPAGEQSPRERLRAALDAMRVRVDEHGVGYDDVAGELAKALRAAHELLAEPEPARDAWQPIETAPKDGTNVLLSEPWQDVTIGWFSQRGRGWCAFYNGFEDNVDENCKPTHWMPLPEAPRRSS